MAEPQRILVVQPSWVGDCVMATPALRSLRERFAGAHIAYLARRYVKPLYAGMPWCDQILTYRTGPTRARAGRGLLELTRRVRAGRFDLAVLLPNSFRLALICRMAGIKRRVGYDRDGRGFLLTDKLLPAKHRGKYVPTPAVQYYLGLAQYLGARARDGRLELFVTEAERLEARRLLAAVGLEPDVDRRGRQGRGPLVYLNPGAQFGDAKCWLPEHFAAVGDALVEQRGATLLLGGTPRERPILDAVLKNLRHPAIDLAARGLTLGSLKEIVRRCDLMVTNDTGPRHVAAAFGVPVVTVFGPTDPRWTEIDFPAERQVSVSVFCGPCQRKRCPLDHRCMTRVTPGMVLAATEQVLDGRTR
jgi:heptosyltransferase-2